MIQLKIFISSVQKELRRERIAVGGFLATDDFLRDCTAPRIFEDYPQPLHPNPKGYLWRDGDVLRPTIAGALLLARQPAIALPQSRRSTRRTNGGSAGQRRGTIAVAQSARRAGIGMARTDGRTRQRDSAHDPPAGTGRAAGTGLRWAPGQQPVAGS